MRTFTLEFGMIFMGTVILGIIPFSGGDSNHFNSQQQQLLLQQRPVDESTPFVLTENENQKENRRTQGVSSCPAPFNFYHADNRIVVPYGDETLDEGGGNAHLFSGSLTASPNDDTNIIGLYHWQALFFPNVTTFDPPLLIDASFQFGTDENKIELMGATFGPALSEIAFPMSSLAVTGRSGLFSTTLGEARLSLVTNSTNSIRFQWTVYIPC